MPGMVHAFVLMKTGAGLSPSVIDALDAVDGVLEAHVVAGEFDVIAEVEVAEVHDVLEVVSNRVQSIEGVVNTKTYIAFD